MRLGIVYHMPFWRSDDGALWEAEGSFGRYVDSLAPYFDEISLCVPVARGSMGEGTKIRSTNVTLAPFPFFEGPRQFYPQLPSVMKALRAWVPTLDALNCRVPTPAAWFAFREARRAKIPVFLLVVGDLRAIAPTLPYRGLKRAVFGAYTAFEEWAINQMAGQAVTFTNGADLAVKYRDRGRSVVETKTTTISADEIASRTDTCRGPMIRMLTVSRIDPRKGLGCLPDAVARLCAAGHDVRLDIVGPAVGETGVAERARIEEAAKQMGVADRIRLVGQVPLDRLMPLYREYDLFVLPTRPGEGIPRVLLEAMAAGVPVIATRVSGIPSLVTHERNGLLIEESSGEAVAGAAARLIADEALGRRLIENGRETARAHTLEAQAAHMMSELSARVPLRLRRAPAPAA